MSVGQRVGNHAVQQIAYLQLSHCVYVMAFYIYSEPRVLGILALLLANEGVRPSREENLVPEVQQILATLRR